MLCVCDFCLDGFSEGISANSRNCFLHLENCSFLFGKKLPILELMFKTS